MVIALWRRLQIVFQLLPVETFPSGQVKSTGTQGSLYDTSIVSRMNLIIQLTFYVENRYAPFNCACRSTSLLTSFIIIILTDTVREPHPTSLNVAAYQSVINESD